MAPLAEQLLATEAMAAPEEKVAIRMELILMRELDQEATEAPEEMAAEQAVEAVEAVKASTTTTGQTVARQVNADQAELQ